MVEVDRTTPIRTDTRARLEVNMLSGVAADRPRRRRAGRAALTAGPGQPLPTIFADRSDFQDIMEMARTLARRADDILERVGRVVTDNEGAINRTIQNAETFTRALGDNAPGVDKLPGAGRPGGRADGAAGREARDAGDRRRPSSCAPSTGSASRASSRTSRASRRASARTARTSPTPCRTWPASRSA